MLRHFFHARHKGVFVLLFVLLVCVAAASFAEEVKQPPLPRFVSVRADAANVRKGPDTRYPIAWVIVRKGIPLEVIAEFGQWRRIRDIQGDEGWVHRAMLSSKRTATVTGSTQTLRAEADEKAAPVARIEVGISGELLSCTTAWCRLTFDKGYTGWVLRTRLWGIYKNEVLEE